MYSELSRAKSCFEFEDCVRKRAWAAVISFSYFRCFGVSGGFSSKWPTPWLPLVSTRMGREPYVCHGAQTVYFTGLLSC
jgi:hypothetical protein